MPCKSRRRAPPIPSGQTQEESGSAALSSRDPRADIRPDARDVVGLARRQLDVHLALLALPLDPQAVFVLEAGDEGLAAARDEELLAVADELELGAGRGGLAVLEHDAHQRA